MNKKPKKVITNFDKETQQYEKISIKAPKGKRKMGIDQNGKVILYDDKGNIIAVQG